MVGQLASLGNLGNLGNLDSAARGLAQQLAQLDGTADIMSNLQRQEVRLQKLVSQMATQQKQLDDILAALATSGASGVSGVQNAPYGGPTGSGSTDGARSGSQWRDALNRFLSSSS